MKNIDTKSEVGGSAPEGESRVAGRLMGLSKWMREKAGPAVLAASVVFAPRESPGAEQRTTNRSESMRAEESRMKVPDMHWSVFRKDESGNVRFDPWALLFPVQVELPRSVQETRKETFVIPYEYSRGFDSAKNLDPESYQKLLDYVEQQVKTQLADVLHAFDRNKEVHGVHHGEPGVRSVRVGNIAVTGFASPEGPEKEGPKTLAQGAVDEKNVALGELRGRDVASAVKEAFSKAGISMPNADVRAEEVQFNNEEMSALAELASHEEGTDILEKIFNLIIKYNAGQITNGESKDKLDKIIDSKRSVAVTITYEGEHEETLIIPVPIFLTIPLGGLSLWLRRRRNPPDFGKTFKPSAPFSGGTPEQPPIEVPIPEKVRETPLPPRESPGYQDMEETTYIDDLRVFFDDYDTVRRGLNYRGMVSGIAKSYDNFSDDEARESHWATVVLQKWHQHDRQAREEAGLSGADLDNGLDYENQESQIRWARMHARALIDLARVAKAKEDTSEEERYDAVTKALEWRTTALLGRRISRHEDFVSDSAIS